jgi:alkylhydroperoxidase family enzyme
MTWLNASVPGATEFDRVFGLCPSLYDDFRHFVSLFWSLRPIDPVILELCQLRIAQLLGGDPAPTFGQQSTGVSAAPPDKIAALEQWREAAVFSDRERACLAFAEKFVLQPHGVTDEDAAAVTAHLSDKEMIAFTEALAVFDGFTRFRLALGIKGKD